MQDAKIMLSRTVAVMLLGLGYVTAVAQEDYVPDEGLYQLGLAKSWQLQLGLACDQCLVDVFLVDDQLYFPTNDGYAFAVDAATGANRWLRQITTEGYRIRRPAAAGGRVIFATASTVTQVNKITGDGIAQMQLRFPCGTGPASDGSRLFLGGVDRRLYAFDVFDPLQNWRVITNGPISGTPVTHRRPGTDERDVFFASDDGTVYCAAAYDKALRWVARTYGPLDSDLAVNEFGLYVPCLDQSLYRFDLTFGELRWRVRFSAPLREPPVLVGGSAYQYTVSDGLVAIDAVGIGVDERIKWKLPSGRMLLTTDDRRVFVLAIPDTIVAIDANSGEVAGVIPAPGMSLGVPAPGRSTIYVASPDGRVFCARPRGTPLVRSEDLREALATAPPEAKAETAAGQPQAPPAATAGTPTSTEPPIGGRSKVSKGYGGKP
jgi:outer membrane protein assembly factor BamB